MRGVLIAALVAGTVGLAGTSPTIAAPINGAVLQDIQSVDLEKARWYCRHWGYSRRRCWRRGYY
jgi:hypothetical protein